MLVRLVLAPKTVEVEEEEVVGDLVVEDLVVEGLVVEDKIEGGAPDKRPQK